MKKILKEKYRGKNPIMLENEPHRCFPDEENKHPLHLCPPIPEGFKSEAWLEIWRNQLVKMIY